jgi:hypothetical protein
VCLQLGLDSAICCRTQTGVAESRHRWLGAGAGDAALRVRDVRGARRGRARGGGPAEQADRARATLQAVLGPAAAGAARRCAAGRRAAAVHGAAAGARPASLARLTTLAPAECVMLPRLSAAPSAEARSRVRVRSCRRPARCRSPQGPADQFCAVKVRSWASRQMWVAALCPLLAAA